MSTKPTPWSLFLDSSITEKDDVQDILRQLADGNTFVAQSQTECGEAVYDFTCRNKKIGKGSAIYWVSNTERRKLIRFFKEKEKKGA